MIQKSFLITGISNDMSGKEDAMTRNEDLRKEIEAIMMSVFGDRDEVETDDPLDTSSDSDSDLYLYSDDNITRDCSVTPPPMSPISSPIILSSDI